MQSHRRLFLLALLAVLSAVPTVLGRPLVRHIRSTHEFERLLNKHATETGLPVIADFYSDGCGPCRMIAPVFKQVAKETGQENAVFVKIDTNALHELSGKYGVRSLPTFIFFYNGKKVNEFSGAGEQQLRQLTQQVVSKSQRENVILKKETLVEYYKTKDATKTEADIDKLHRKCADVNKRGNKEHECFGAAATNLARSLKKKYGDGPETEPRFDAAARAPQDAKESSSFKSTKTSGKADKPNLHLASKEELLAELEKRMDDEEDAAVEEEDDDDAEFEHSWSPGEFPERVTIIGGGPAGLGAAIYAARAGLTPLVVAPPMGGQLQGKGVDVENYPGLINVTGPAVVSAMRAQAADFGAMFEAEEVISVDASSRPLRVKTNSSVIETHAVIVATGAESNWLGIPGEYELRGGGVSSCATCDGAIFRGKDVLVVGGGDAAMEDALVLARTSKSVTVIHRRDEFRASKILAQRVIEHPSINVRWNATVQKITGKDVAVPADSREDSDDDNIDLDDASNASGSQKIVSGAVLRDVSTGEEAEIACDAVFVAIGHTPSTSYLRNVVEFDLEHPGYVRTYGSTTKTSVPGIFAAGDVSDPSYRQAVTSAGSGAMAALDAERWLSEEGLGNEAAEFEAELLAELMAEESSRPGADDSGYNAYEDAGRRVSGMKESVGAEL
uniref:Thioredoxin domain-containing protein n=1 Tax=Pseudictyota dubia TaxID=2749911 RepID=A0A7R9W8X7_9STRA|mmetsp:Transcript_39498/g.72880  ORF Transcript_39498/g.72880 Transcript_39498/m.72880 type:complete len:674 (+) Transcript_39498:84-2105(+)|eukprot:CAMPEP_0197460134 /NCGR_PEP_ID=MMETSP1175-20131217/53292_1 /TAXON_ID=1003142 /ORGANISM="Triceratium dubium, Strain CCMP147" /LENGTH=673 /DNA_ID=CAMNT_0042995169 /DNA_START=82 /DNA_END=2103 /DNA_ORIENTATION=+